MEEPNLEVKDFINERGWMTDKLRAHILEDLTKHILENIKPQKAGERDRTWWMGNTKGEFFVKSTFHYLRKKKEE